MKLKANSLLLLVVLSGLARASDWSNAGGNAARSGLSSLPGPSAPTTSWSRQDGSLRGTTPIVEGPRVYHVRPQQVVAPFVSPVTCTDLASGARLWSVDLPNSSGDNPTWLVGAKNNAVYAIRSTILYKLDGLTGATIWARPTPFFLAPADDAAFTDEGDLVIGSQVHVTRLRASDGSTQWQQPRTFVHPSGAPCAIANGIVFMADRFSGSPLDVAIVKIDLATGTPLSEKSIPFSESATNPLFVAPDGSVYQPYTQRPPLPPEFRMRAFTSTPTGLQAKWDVLSGQCFYSHFAVGQDGSVYQYGPGSTIQRLDGATGAILQSVPIVTDIPSPSINIACDSAGHVYVSNGAGFLGTIYCFDSALQLLWTTNVPQLARMAPALASNGALLVSGSNPDLISIRSDPSSLYCSGDGSASPCPCGNQGAPAHGCANSIFSNGARLEAIGIPSVSADSLVLMGSEMPNSTALYFQGTARTGGGAGLPFGDGLRCAGGTTVRLATTQNAVGSSLYPAPGDVSISLRGLIPATAGIRYYQIWYRNAASFCTPSTHNLSNGIEITWTP